MFRRMLAPVFAVMFSFGGAVGQAAEYGLDPVHSSVYFRIQHAGLAYVYGRFDRFTGSCNLDANDPAKCSFTLNIVTDSVDTNNAGRDKHLRGPDFFNAPQFPALTFKSTAVKAATEGYEVTGDLTMHGVTKSVTFTFVGGRKAQFPPGTERTGFSMELKLKRSDFDMKFGGQMLGDEVQVAISCEYTKK